MSGLSVWTIPEQPVDEREVLRYAMMPGGQPPESLPLAHCLQEVRGRLRCRAVSARYPIVWEENALDLGFALTESYSLRRALTGCMDIFLFAATAGTEMDLLIRRYQRISPGTALLMHAIGVERIESACDTLMALLSETLSPGEKLKPRFSPGYGDLPLALQRDVFTALDCERKIGLTLTDSLLMVPSKSVTAIVGILPGGAA